MFSSLCSVVLMVGINVEWSYLFCVRGGAGWWQWTWFELCVYFGDWDRDHWSLEQWPEPGVTSCLATRRVWRVWRSRGVRRWGCAGAGVSRNNQQAVITALGCWHRSHHTQLLATCWLVSTEVSGLDWDTAGHVTWHVHVSVCLHVPPEPGPTLHVSALKPHPELSILVKGNVENIWILRKNKRLRKILCSQYRLWEVHNKVWLVMWKDKYNLRGSNNRRDQTIQLQPRTGGEEGISAAK